MNFAPMPFIPDPGLAAIRSIIEFVSDPVEMARLGLTTSVSEFEEGGGFVGMTPEVLGRSDLAPEFGRLHDRAHVEYKAAMDGVKEDLAGFLDAFAMVEQTYIDTDDAAAQSMQVRTDVLYTMVNAADDFGADGSGRPAGNEEG